MITPSALGLLLPAFPPEKRTQIVSLWGGMGALGVVAGPTVGALLIEHFGWRAAFYVNVPVCSIAIVGGWFILTETPRQVSAHRPDFIGAAMITLSLASLALAISEGNRWGWGSVTTIAIFALETALIPAFIQRCRRNREPTGSAINTTARHVGGVIGVATLVAVIGDGAPVLSDFHHGWVLVLLAIAASTLFSSRINVKPAVRAARP